MDVLRDADLGGSAAGLHRLSRSRNLPPRAPAPQSPEAAGGDRQRGLDGADREDGQVGQPDTALVLRPAIPAARIRADGEDPQCLCASNERVGGN